MKLININTLQFETSGKEVLITKEEVAALDINDGTFEIEHSLAQKLTDEEKKEVKDYLLERMDTGNARFFDAGENPDNPIH